MIRNRSPIKMNYIRNINLDSLLKFISSLNADFFNLSIMTPLSSKLSKVFWIYHKTHNNLLHFNSYTSSHTSWNLLKSSVHTSLTNSFNTKMKIYYVFLNRTPPIMLLQVNLDLGWMKYLKLWFSSMTNLVNSLIQRT